MSIIFDGTNGITFPAGGQANPAGNLVSTGGNLVLQTADTMVMQTAGTTAVTIGSDQSVTMTGNLTVSGNIAGDYILGNGSQLTGLPESYTNANVAAYLPTYTGNLVGLTGNVTTTATVSATTLAGTLSTSAQPNVTSVGTLSALNVTSNVNIGSTTNYGGLLSVNRAQTSSIADLLTLRDASAGTTFNLQTYGDPTFGTVNRFNYDGAYLAIRRSGTEQMRLDSAGRVTMPLQPSFRAWSPASGNYTTTAGGIIPFTGTAHNVGGHFNTSTYRFTAPVAGSYLFCWVAYNNGSNGERISIVLNGTTRMGQGSRNGTANDWEQTVIFYMAAGDYADVRSTYGGGTVYLAPAHTEFAGFLIG